MQCLNLRKYRGGVDEMDFQSPILISRIITLRLRYMDMEGIHEQGNSFSSNSKSEGGFVARPEALTGRVLTLYNI